MIFYTYLLNVLDVYQGWGGGKFFFGSGSSFFFSRLRLRLLIFFFQPAPAPHFFFNRLRLRLLIFFQAAPAPAPRGQKHPAPTGSLALGSIYIKKIWELFLISEGWPISGPLDKGFYEIEIDITFYFVMLFCCVAFSYTKGFIKKSWRRFEECCVTLLWSNFLLYKDLF